MREAGYNASEILQSAKAGVICNRGWENEKYYWLTHKSLYQCSDLQLKNLFKFSAFELYRGLGLPLDQARNRINKLGFHFHELLSSGFSLKELVTDFNIPIKKLVDLNLGYDITHFKRDNVSLVDLKRSGAFEISDFKRASYSAKEMADCCISYDLNKCNKCFSLLELKEYYSTADLYNAFEIEEMRKAGFSCNDLVEEVRKKRGDLYIKELKSAGYSASNLLALGSEEINKKVLFDEGYSFEDLNFSKFDSNELRELKAVGFNVSSIFEEIKKVSGKLDIHLRDILKQFKDAEYVYVDVPCDHLSGTVCKSLTWFEYSYGVDRGRGGYTKRSLLRFDFYNAGYPLMELYSRDQLQTLSDSISAVVDLMNEKFELKHILGFNSEGLKLSCKQFEYANKNGNKVPASYLASNPIRSMSLSELKDCYSIKELKSIFNSSLTKFRKAGYTVEELSKNNEFDVSQLLQAGFGVADIYDNLNDEYKLSREKKLFKAGLTIDELRYYLEKKNGLTLNKNGVSTLTYTLYKEKGFSLRDLAIDQFDKVHFENHGFTLFDIYEEFISRNGSPTQAMAELKSKGYKCSELYDLYDARKIIQFKGKFQEIGCTIIQLAESEKIMNSPVILIDDEKFTYFQLYEAGYSLKDLPGKHSIDLDYLNNGDFKTLTTKWPGGFDYKSLKHVVPETRLQDMIEALDLSLKALIDAQYSLPELKANTAFTISDYKKAGFLWPNLVAAGYTIRDLYNSNQFSLEDMYANGVKLFDLYQEGFTISQLSQHYKLTDFRENNFELAELVAAKLPSGKFLFKLKDFIAAKYSAADIISAGVPFDRFTHKDEAFKLGDLYRLDSELFSMERLRLSGAKIDTLKRENFDLTLIKSLYEKDSIFTLYDIKKDGKYTCEEFKTHGFSLSEMKDAGFTIKEIKNSKPTYKLRDFRDSGAYSLSELCASKLFDSADITKEFPDLKLLREAKCM